MRKRSALPLFAALCLAFSAPLCGCETKAKPEQRGIFAMDTFFSVTVYDGTGDADEVFRLTEELEKKLSVTDAESEISAINRADGSAVAVSAQTAELLRETLRYSALTGGALDPTLYPVTAAWGFTGGSFGVPDSGALLELLKLTGYEKAALDGDTVRVPPGTMLDLGATAKGYALEKAAELLKSGGAVSAVLDFGGNIRTIGVKPDGSLWRTAVADPAAPSENLCIVEMGEGAAATSGSYQRYFTGEDGARYCHIIDPLSGRPVDNGTAGVTVIADSALLCDALSTALFVMGREGAERFWRENGGFEMIIAGDDGKIYYTGGLSGSFRPSEGKKNAQTEVITK